MLANLPPLVSRNRRAPEALVRFCAARPRVVYLDLETTGTDPYQDQPLLLALHADAHSLVLDVRQADLSPLVGLFEQALVVGHHLLFDLQVLAHHYQVWARQAWCTYLAERVLTAGTRAPCTLEALADRYLGRPLDKRLQASFAGVDVRTWQPTPEQLEYARADVEVLPRIRAAQQDALVRARLTRVAALEMQFLTRVAVPMLVRGVLLDREAWERELQALDQAAQDLAQALDAALGPSLAQYWADRARRAWEARAAWEQAYADVKRAHPRVGRHLAPEVREWRAHHPPPPLPKAPPSGLNPRSRDQVLAGLRALGLDLPNLQARTLATWVDLPDLTPDQRAVLGLILRYAKVQKLASAFGHSLLAQCGPDGRLHGDLVQVLSTGRMARSRPNLQTLPDPLRLPEGTPGRAFRSLILPPPGWVCLMADYSQIEPRIAVARHGERALVRAFVNAQDLYLTVLADMRGVSYEQALAGVRQGDREMVLWRQLAKKVFLGAMYGMGPNRLCCQGVELGDGSVYRPSWGEARDLMERFARQYPALVRGLAADGQRAVRQGYVCTGLGRRRYFPPPDPSLPESERARLRAAIERQGRNAPIQGTSADIIKQAACLVAERLDPERAYVWNLVHDELDLFVERAYADQAQALVRECMVQAAAPYLGEVPVDVRVVVADRWAGH